MKFPPETTILFIDNAEAPLILPLIRSFSGFRNLHLDVLVISIEKPLLFRYSKYIRRVYYVKGNIDDEFETAVRDSIKQSDAQLVIPASERVSKLLFKHRGWLEPLVRIHPVSENKVLDTVTDKWKLNQWLKDNHFPCSKAIRVDSELIETMDSISFPFPAVLKPLEGFGGLGIKQINDLEELKDILIQNDQYRNGHLLQECIQGYDIDMSLFSIEGRILIYTIQKGIISGPFTAPKAIEFVKNEKLFNLVERIIEKLGYSGVAHMDFRYDSEKQQFILVDFNARYWGSLQGSRVMGINFPVLATAYTLGIPVRFPNQYNTGTFYNGTTAISKSFRNLFSKTRYPVKLRNTQLYFFIRDPAPELLFLLMKLFKPFRSVL